MKKHLAAARQPYYSPRAVLAAIGLQLLTMGILEPIYKQVRIKQKRLKYSPAEKLTDALITILGGARGMAEINTRLRSDQALQRAFGRTRCAEQSVVLLDIDMSGLPCGKQQEEAAKGYQGEHGIRWGRQLGRVLAAQYEEIVIDRLYPGNIYLIRALQPLIQDLEVTLALDNDLRKRTIIRMDAGGGNVDGVNWLLERGYQIHGKDISPARAENFAQAVTHWISDPKHPHRQMGWAEGQIDGYVRPVKRLILRWPPMKYEKWKKKPFHYACLLSTLEPQEVIRQLNLPLHTINNPDAVTLAYSTLYDQRGGTVEVEFKESKQGIGIHKWTTHTSDDDVRPQPRNHRS